MKECNIEKVLNGRLAEFCYFIHANDNDCICIDPGYETDRIMRYIEQHNLVVKEILLTHGHFDHMLSCYYLQQKFGSNIYISKEDEEILYNAEHNYSNLINKTTFDEFKIKDYVKDNEMINLLGYDIRCISTPGHTKGSMSFYFETQKVLFSGDIKSLTSEELLDAFNNIPSSEVSGDKNIIDLLVETNICSSKREAREFVSNNSISVNGDKVNDLEFIIKKDNAIVDNFTIIRKGKKKYFVIKHI